MSPTLCTHCNTPTITSDPLTHTTYCITCGSLSDELNLLSSNVIPYESLDYYKENDLLDGSMDLPKPWSKHVIV